MSVANLLHASTSDGGLLLHTGMPLISDPGSGLVQAAVAAGFQVIPVPGPSAFLLALVASGLPSTQFTFAGFLADKAKARQRQLQNLAGCAPQILLSCNSHYYAFQHGSMLITPVAGVT